MLKESKYSKHSRRRFLLKSVVVGAGLSPPSVFGYLPEPGTSGNKRPAAVASSESKPIDEEASKQPEMQALIRDASKFERLRSLVVLEQGEVIVAKTFSGPDISAAVNIKSVSKSVLSAITGSAIERGVFDSVEQTLGELAPGLIPVGADRRVKQLSMENLLTMQTGLQRTSGPNYGAWVSSSDWVAYVLQRPFLANPGSQMFYSTGDWHVLGAVLSELTGQSLLTLSREWLGKPLNIDFAPWTRDPQGRYMGGNEMSLSPLHLAKFGQLYLDHGGSVLSRDWVEKSLTPRTRSPWSGDAYGYGWFIRDHNAPIYYYGRGFGGQFVFLLPSSQRVAVISSDWTRAARGGVYTEQLHELIVQHCL